MSFALNESTLFISRGDHEGSRGAHAVLRSRAGGQRRAGSHRNLSRLARLHPGAARPASDGHGSVGRSALLVAQHHHRTQNAGQVMMARSARKEPSSGTKVKGVVR